MPTAAPVTASAGPAANTATAVTAGVAVKKEPTGTTVVQKQATVATGTPAIQVGCSITRHYFYCSCLPTRKLVAWTNYTDGFPCNTYSFRWKTYFTMTELLP